MNYKHVKNITELFTKEFSKCIPYQEAHISPNDSTCYHTSEELSSKPFCLDITCDLDCPAYRVLWITPDGTPLFTRLGYSNNPQKKALIDHRNSVFYILKLYYQTLDDVQKPEVLEHFFGLMHDHTQLLEFFESKCIFGENLPLELKGRFDSEDYEYIIKNVKQNPKLNYRIKPRFNDFLQRFINTTGIIRVRLKTIEERTEELDTTNTLREQIGYNIETWKKLTLNQQQFLKSFIKINKLIEKNALFIDDNTPYKTVKLSLGVVVEERFHSFGHAYRVLTNKK